jgi:hypothetical protein
MMKYYFVRILAALFIMGSSGFGFLVGGAYGRLAGWGTFLILITFGIILHKLAARQYKKT